MASNILRKINPKPRLLYRRRRYLTSTLRRPLSNALIQPHFDYWCSSWFPLLKENLKIKLRKAQNKYIRFCLNLPLRSRINPTLFRKNKVMLFLWISFLSTSMERYRIIHEIFELLLLGYSTGSQMPLDIPLRKTNTGQERLSFFGQKIWSRINPSNKNVKQRFLSCML